MRVRLAFLTPVVVWCMTAGVFASTPSAGQAAAAGQDLKKLSIEELMEISVTLATREPAPIRDAPAAIDVVTGDDIRRSGVTTIADAVALAQGVNVARVNNGSWAVSTRGFNATSANKLLVMVDGRTEYSPLFSGAFWNMLDYVLEDIDRIEVIRGPGATLWGANAVNGVVNIVTRHARDTQGSYAAIGSGNEDPVLADFRYGARAGETAYYRVYGKYADRDSQVFATGESSSDRRRRGQFGFRVDAGAPAGDTWLLKGDVFHSRDGFIDRPSGEFTELALQGRWSHALAADSRINLQAYYRREYRRVPQQLTHHIDTADVDFQHATVWRRRHRVVWGAGARVNSDDTDPGVIAFEPAERTYSMFNVFAQDEIELRDGVHLTAGLKMERNTFSGPEWQPNVRARFQIAPRQMLWGAVSRAVRRPTRLDVDVRAFSPSGDVIAVGGGDSYDAETLTAAEVGYRIQPHPVLSLDATVFGHLYDDLRSQELPPTGPPIVVGNTLHARSSGVELSAVVHPLPVWRVYVNYTFLDLAISREAGSRDIGGGATEANDPRHLLGLRNSFDLTPNVEFDAILRRVGELPNPSVPAYTELNVRLGWQVTPRVELSVAGQDLLHDHHPEFGAQAPQRVEFQRSVRALAAFRY
jgi:iron complex outermembrane receptor protein